MREEMSAVCRWDIKQRVTHTVPTVQFVIFSTGPSFSDCVWALQSYHHVISISFHILYIHFNQTTLASSHFFSFFNLGKMYHLRFVLTFEVCVDGLKFLFFLNCAIWFINSV